MGLGISGLQKGVSIDGAKLLNPIAFTEKQSR